MDDHLSRYLAATEANDVDGFMATLTPDVEVVSPISGRMVFAARRTSGFCSAPSTGA